MKTEILLIREWEGAGRLQRIESCPPDHYHLCQDRQHQNHDYDYQNDFDLLVINEEEEGVVCDKLGVDQWSGRSEPGHSTI